MADTKLAAAEAKDGAEREAGKAALADGPTLGTRLAEFKRNIVAEYGGRLTPKEVEWLTPEVLWIFYKARPDYFQRMQIIVPALRWRMGCRHILGSHDAAAVEQAEGAAVAGAATGTALVCPTCAADPRSHDARLFGFDADGDPVFMNCFAFPADVTPENITCHMTCLFERALRLAEARGGNPSTCDASLVEEPRITKWSWVIDITGFGMRHMDPRTTIQLLELLQVVYRGRLKKMLIVDAPMLFWSLWYMIKKFIKPATAALIEFVDWGSGPGCAEPQYRALFGDVIAEALLAEGREARGDAARLDQKQWTTFYAGPGLAHQPDGGA